MLGITSKRTDCRVGVGDTNVRSSGYTLAGQPAIKVVLSHLPSDSRGQASAVKIFLMSDIVRGLLAMERSGDWME